jgi:DNA transformation protein and related proteins
MSSDPAFVDYVCDQIGGAGSISHRKMFGEYASYCDDKVIALVCDNQFFVKPTAGGHALIGTPTEGLPYHGAKPWFLIGDELDDREWVTQLVRA